MPKEVDLSAGAVYRCFSGKEELIGAIVTEVLDEVCDTFEEGAPQSPPPPPDVLVGWVLTKMLDKRPGLTDEGASILPRLIIQVWAETLRNATTTCRRSSTTGTPRSEGNGSRWSRPIRTRA
ncbi:TetR/AcrR family transcriptional regulator [Streptomyces sp. NPDC058470]|uniref:TetR/AcrR family transcriptional regulator n=1 Tax=Streptomyces sp. NPDC058470 TaxID=3346515 RepID=UPI00364CCE1B